MDPAKNTSSTLQTCFHRNITKSRFPILPLFVFFSSFIISQFLQISNFFFLLLLLLLSKFPTQFQFEMKLHPEPFSTRKLLNTEKHLFRDRKSTRLNSSHSSI